MSRNVNSKLSERLINVEQNSFKNEKYSRNECLEIPGVSLVSRIINWRPKRSSFWEELTTL